MNYTNRIIEIYIIIYILAIMLVLIFHQAFVLITLCIPVYGIIWYLFTFNFHNQVFEYTRKFNPKFHKKYSPENGKYFVFGGLTNILIPINDIETIQDINIQEKMKFVKYGFGIFLSAFFIVVLSTIIVVVIQN